MKKPKTVHRQSLIIGETRFRFELGFELGRPMFTVVHEEFLKKGQPPLENGRYSIDHRILPAFITCLSRGLTEIRKPLSKRQREEKAKEGSTSLLT